MAISKRNQFKTVFKETMLEAGFKYKKNAFFRFDLSENWMQSVFVNFYAGGNAYRTCVVCYPFTSKPIHLETITDDVFIDVENIMRYQHGQKFEIWYPCKESFDSTLQEFRAHVLPVLLEVNTFSESIDCYLTLQKWMKYAPPLETEPLMYAYLLMHQNQKAIEMAEYTRVKYMQSAIDIEREIREIHKKVPQLDMTSRWERVVRCQEKSKEMEECIVLIRKGETAALIEKAKRIIEKTQKAYIDFFART